MSRDCACEFVHVRAHTLKACAHMLCACVVVTYFCRFVNGVPDFSLPENRELSATWARHIVGQIITVIEKHLLMEKEPEIRAIQIVEQLWQQPDMRKLATVLGYCCRRGDLAVERHIAQQVRHVVQRHKNRVNSGEGRCLLRSPINNH